MNPPDFQLLRNTFGRLVLTTGDGQVYENIVPVRAFPISAPDTGLALVDEEGHERAWIADLATLKTTFGSEMCALIEAALAEREFMPCILRLNQVSTFATPSTWQVSTNCGETSFVLKGEEDIRLLSATSLLITDRDGVQYRIPDITQLDKHSRRLLDRFL
ncbi:MAG: DUF1854 domain-containing protein [Burkholderiales bacterium]|jgi:hypothetical protein|nr:DUF1854 domain-containing protein [Burkholderiales bacterium]